MKHLVNYLIQVLSIIKSFIIFNIYKIGNMPDLFNDYLNRFSTSIKKVVDREAPAPAENEQNAENVANDVENIQSVVENIPAPDTESTLVRGRIIPKVKSKGFSIIEEPPRHRLQNDYADTDVDRNQLNEEAERQRILADELQRDLRERYSIPSSNSYTGYFSTPSSKKKKEKESPIKEKREDKKETIVDLGQLNGFLLSVMEQRELILGKSLYHKLKRMGDPISNLLVDLHNNSDVLNIDFSYIDTANEEGFISYMPIKKKDIGSEKNIWKHPNRQKTKISRLITAISNERGIKFTQPEIDSFVAKYRAIQKNDDSENLDFADWKIIKGEEIIKWYNGNSYHRAIDGGDTLNKSCMRYDKCGDFLKVYTHTNFVSLLILTSKANGLLLGRALVWNDITIDGEKATFMDRIYCVEGPLDELFKSYAEKRGWWYKTTQNAKPYTPITNGRDVKNGVIKAYITTDIDWNDRKSNRVPYLDTLKLFNYVVNSEGNSIPVLSNDERQTYMENWSYNHGGYCEECDGKGVHEYNEDDDDRRDDGEFELTDDAPLYSNGPTDELHEVAGEGEVEVDTDEGIPLTGEPMDFYEPQAERVGEAIDELIGRLTETEQVPEHQNMVSDTIINNIILGNDVQITEQPLAEPELLDRSIVDERPILSEWQSYSSRSVYSSISFTDMYRDVSSKSSSKYRRHTCDYCKGTGRR